MPQPCCFHTAPVLQFNLDSRSYFVSYNTAVFDTEVVSSSSLRFVSTANRDGINSTVTLRSCQKRENLVINLVRPELCLVPFSIDVTAKHGFNGIRKKQTRGLYRAIQQSRLRHSPLRCQKSLPVIIYRYVNVARSTASINYTGYTTGFEGAETTANRHQSNVTRPS